MQSAFNPRRIVSADPYIFPSRIRWSTSVRTGATLTLPFRRPVRALVGFVRGICHKWPTDDRRATARKWRRGRRRPEARATIIQLQQQESGGRPAGRTRPDVLLYSSSAQFSTSFVRNLFQFHGQRAVWRIGNRACRLQKQIPTVRDAV